MRRFIHAGLLAVAVIAAWYGVWSSMMAGDVARVKGSIDYQYQALREHTRSVSLKSDGVFASGFPFRFEVAVQGLTVSMVEGGETFAVSLPVVTLRAADAGLGRYRVALPATFDALYAKDGAAPEHYVITADALPKLMLSAQDAKTLCGPLTGTRCVPVAVDAPFISFAAEMPRAVVLHMVLGGEAKDARFEFTPLSVPVYWPIPSDIARPLQLFVGVLREALIYKGKW